MKALASALGTREHTVAVIASKGQPVVVAVACSPDSGTAATDVLSVLTDAFGGKGGGRADFAQAGGLSGSPDAALEKARLFLRSR